MSLFLYTRDEYDKMFIRLPDVEFQTNLQNHLSGFNMIFEYINRDFMMYSRNGVIEMIRFLSQYFSLCYYEGTNEIYCQDANNNLSSLNHIVIECFNFRN